MTSSDLNQSPGSREQDATGRIADVGREAMSDATQTVTETVRSRVEQGKSTAAGSATTTAEVLEHAAEEFSEHGQETLARATRLLSGKLSDLAHQMEHRSIDELSRDAMRLARNNPGLFIAGGIALGLALSRFIKATAPEHRGYGSGQSGHGMGEQYGRSAYGGGQPGYGYDQPDYGQPSGQPHGQPYGSERDPAFGSEAAVPPEGAGVGASPEEGARGPARAPGSNRGATGGSESGNPMGSGGLHE